MFPRRSSRYTGHMVLGQSPFPTQLPALIRRNTSEPAAVPQVPPDHLVPGVVFPRTVVIAARTPAIARPAFPASVMVSCRIAPWRPPTSIRVVALLSAWIPPNPIIVEERKDAVKPTIDDNIIDDSPDPPDLCPVGPYRGLVALIIPSAVAGYYTAHPVAAAPGSPSAGQLLDVSGSPRTALRVGTTTNRPAPSDVDTVVAPGLPVLATAADIINKRPNRHTCDWKLPLNRAILEVKKALPSHPWWGWLARNPHILETMVIMNSGGIWNAVAPLEDFRSYKGTIRARYGACFGLFTLNEFYAGPSLVRAQAVLGSVAGRLITSPDASKPLSDLAKYNSDPGRFAWARSLCHREEGLYWGLLFAGNFLQQLAVSVDPLTGNARGPSTAYQTAISAAKSISPKLPGAVWLRAFFTAGTMEGASRLITARDLRVTQYAQHL